MPLEGCAYDTTIRCDLVVGNILVGCVVASNIALSVRKVAAALTDVK